MVQPVVSVSPVPTPQRPLNGAISGYAAQVAGNAATAYLMAHGLDPATSSMVGTFAGSTVSGGFATIGDLVRGILERNAVPWWGVILLQPFARIG